MLLLHSCPRKFQLYKLRASVSDNDTDGTQSITFAYGTAFGLGIQLALQGKSYDEILWQLFLNWECDLLAADEKRNKSFWLVAAAIQKFQTQIAPQLFQDWELVYYNGQPAVELSFIIDLPNGFKYRGFVDAVLKHKYTGKVRVLETKTTAATRLSGAEYKNSSQALGYSIVLDKIFPDLSSYEVLYLVYLTKSNTYESLPFNKNYVSRALWIQELLLDVQTIEMYEAAGIYPMHGESCNNFSRPCEYLHNCTLSTFLLTAPMNEEIQEALDKDNEKYQIHVTVEELIHAQISRSKELMIDGN